MVSQPKQRILFELKNGQRHGYEIAKRTGLPLGSIYDHLAELVEAGFVEYEEKDRKKIYHLTEKGEMLLEALE